jgi:hypothetical protein
MSTWSPEFLETYSHIAVEAMEGEYDDGMRQKHKSTMVGEDVLCLVVCDEGGKTRDVGDGQSTLYTLTYVARVDVLNLVGAREYWLLDDGRVFHWYQPYGIDKSEGNMEFTDTTAVKDLLDAI